MAGLPGMRGEVEQQELEARW